MKCGVPSGEPRVLPLVRHGEDVLGEKVRPISVAPLETIVWGRCVLIATQPVLDDVVEELLGPKQTRITLATNEAFFCCHVRRNDAGIKSVALGDTLGERFLESVKAFHTRGLLTQHQAAAHGNCRARLNHELEVGRRFGAARFGGYGPRLTVDEVAMEGVLDVRSGVFGTGEAMKIGVVLGKKPLWRAFKIR